MVAITLEEKIQIVGAFINSGLGVDEIERVTGIPMSEIMEIISLYYRD
jgi:hypothetical protein